jgi:hypothetical protein
MFLHRMPAVIWLVIKMKMRWTPAIRFDYALYRRLVRTCPQSTVPPGDHDPEVEFEYEPTFDNILGFYDPKTKKICIDVLEIFVITADDPRIKNLHEFMDRYDEKLTQVLAHEGGHWHLDKRLGRWAFCEQYLINGILILLGLFVVGVPVVLSVLLSGYLADFTITVLPAYGSETLKYGLIALAFWYLYD